MLICEYMQDDARATRGSPWHRPACIHKSELSIRASRRINQFRRGTKCQEWEERTILARRASPFVSAAFLCIVPFTCIHTYSPEFNCLTVIATVTSSCQDRARELP